ncbi:MAG: transglutaminase family protein [Sphingomonadales bacterium]|nr:transglutaminase family protein [Sphingomonadales bacterium]
MKAQISLFAVAIWLCPTTTTAQIADKTIAYAKPADWVAPPPEPGSAPATAEAPLRVLYMDNQVRITADGTQDHYTAYRMHILKAEALGVGNVTITWQPENGRAVIHSVSLIRDGKVTDVLAGTRFTVVQKEDQLEQAILTGRLVATLQIPGLQVGDEIAVAATVSERQPVFGGRVGGIMQMPGVGSPGAYRLRLVWPSDRKLAVVGSSDLPALRPAVTQGASTVELLMRDPPGAIPTDGAPPRYNIRRVVEYSDFGTWADVARLMRPLYDKATILAADSPLRQEVAMIAARTRDPAERAQAALQLVEDRIRYVYVGLDGANYIPAGADETWKRRFGDCKAKTVLLVALLRELGIDAQAALVQSTGGDELERRLPGPIDFNHVIVRATIGKQIAWLDATRMGDRFLDNLPVPFRWALPLAAPEPKLERIEPRDTGFPTLVGLVDIDATAGLEQDAQITASNIIRGDEAFLIRTQLSSLPGQDADRALKRYWQKQFDWALADKVNWAYDERRMAITLSMVGRGNPGWTGNDTEGHRLAIFGAGFYAPDSRRRPLEQDQSANWALEFPGFRCWATTVHLPKPGGFRKWSLYAEPMNERLGGVDYWRASGMNGSIVRTVMSRRSIKPELTPQEVQAVNRAIPNFNNDQSNIAEVSPASVLKSSQVLPFADGVDWINAPRPCNAE